MTIVIDETRDNLLPEISIVTVIEKYINQGETSPQQAFARASQAFADNDAHAQRLYDYASKCWFGFSSPIIGNGGTDKGLPISCYLNYVDDSLEDLADHFTENVFLASGGGGIGSCWDGVRSIGEKTSKGITSTGMIPHLHVEDAQMLAYSQGSTRRGKVSMNLNISHPEIEEFIDVANKKGGDPHRRAVHSFNCVSITDDFMKALAKNADWDLIDPHSKRVTKTVKAKDLWIKILTSRMQEGIPYIHYIDHSRKALPKYQRDLGLEIHQTNLCSEITLPTNEERTAVCCLSSVNLETYDEWKDDPLFIEDLIRMLDNVITYFVDNAPLQLKKAIYSALMERALGLGAMGWHSYLQKHMIAFESAMAISATNNIFGHLEREAIKATMKLAKERGGCPDSESLPDEERPRNSRLLAIAPNATSSIICGNTSPSIEPLYSNFYNQKTQNGLFPRKNKYLQEYLASIQMDTDDVWDSIGKKGGSVQHLDFLPEHIKKVFKTAFEIDQYWIIEQASHRQKKIDQSVSTNLFFFPNEDKEYIHAIHYLAWLKGVKTLYYVRSKAPKKADDLGSKVERTIRKDYTAVPVGEVGYKDEHDAPPEDTCLSCSG